MKKYFPLALLLFSFSCIAQDAYLCITEGSTGFYFNSNQKIWEQTKFKTDKNKNILKKIKNNWEWRDFGNDWGEPCGSLNEYGYLNCKMIFGELRFNSKSLRFLTTYTVGYVDGSNANSNTPAISIGTCTPL
jgi:hypothetical protein